MIEFAHPALLFGTAALALPLLIHWLLRPRPRRVQFPAWTLLAPRLASGQRAQRLRNRRLLAARGTLLAAAALLLAGPRCRSSGPDTALSAAGVILVDDSWSVHYRGDDGRSLLEQSIAAVKSFLRDPRRAGQTPYGLLWTDPLRAGLPLQADRAELAAALDGYTPRAHAATLSAALSRAVRLLGEAEVSPREILIFSDGLAHAWRDLGNDAPPDWRDLRVRVATVATPIRTNLALLGVSLPSVIPENTSWTLSATIRAERLGTRATLRIEHAGETLARSPPLDLPADAEQSVTVSLPPLPRGLYGLTARLEPSDRMVDDQVRYVACEIVPRPHVWLVVESAAAIETDRSTRLLANLLAPAGLPDTQQRLVLQRISADDEASWPDPASDPPALVVVMSGVALIEPIAERLRNTVASGATALLVPSSARGGPDWPGLRRYLSDAAPSVERPANPMEMRWSAGWSGPDARRGLAEFERCAVRQRVLWHTDSAAATSEAVFADGAPALLSIRIGRGTLLALATSPDPSWSDLGTRAAGLLSLMHELIERARPEQTRAANATVGQPMRQAFAGLDAVTQVRVVPLEAAAATPRDIRLEAGRPPAGWPGDQAGLYRVDAAGRAAVALYAMNWPAEESDSTPISTDEVARRCGLASVETLVIEPADTARAPRASPLWPSLTLAQILSAVLLAALAAESLLSRRRPDAGHFTASASPQPPGRQ